MFWMTFLLNILRDTILKVRDVAMGQNLRYLFSRDYHPFKRLFEGHRGFLGVLTHSHAIKKFLCWLLVSQKDFDEAIKGFER